MGEPEERSDLYPSEASRFVQFVLDCIEDIQRCVQQLPIPEEQSLTIEAAIESAREDILAYAKHLGIL